MTDPISWVAYGESQGWTDEEIIKFAVETMGFDESEAWMLLGIERGDDGDVVETNEAE